MTQGETNMTPIDPFREFNILRNELNKFFTPNPFAYDRSAFFSGSASPVYPRLNLQDSTSEVVVEALAPGLDPEKLDVTVHQNKLTIRGERKAEAESQKSENWYRREREVGRFSRTITLPSGVDANAVGANYKNGVLRIALPKKEEAKPKQISVSIA